MKPQFSGNYVAVLWLYFSAPVSTLSGLLYERNVEIWCFHRGNYEQCRFPGREVACHLFLGLGGSLFYYAVSIYTARLPKVRLVVNRNGFGRKKKLSWTRTITEFPLRDWGKTKGSVRMADFLAEIQTERPWVESFLRRWITLPTVTRNKLPPSSGSNNKPT